MNAYRTVESWIRQWSTPENAQPLDPAGSTGACVTLRLNGRVIGRVVAMEGDGECVWRAARAALAEADANAPVENDALRSDRMRDIARRVTIDLQIAGTLTPLLGDTTGAAVASLDPGRHGVAARVAGAIAAVFPGTQLSMNWLPQQGMEAAIAELRLPPVRLSELRERHGLVIYSFEACHLAQITPEAAPIFLHRGGAIIPRSDVSEQGLRRFADRLAAHLLTHAWPRTEDKPLSMGLTGDYAPLLDRYDPLVASPLDQGIACFALSRYAGCPGAHAETAGAAADLARRIVRELVIVEDGEADPLADAPSAAAFVIAHSALRRLPARADNPSSEPATDAFAASALQRVRTDISGKAGSGRVLTPAEKALCVYALACAARHNTDEKSPLAAEAERALRALLRETSFGDVASLMPWAGWAELDLSGDGEIPSELMLRQFRDETWRHQLSDADTGVRGADFAGGIVFTRTEAGLPSLPTWSSLRPVAFLATMLGDHRLTDNDEMLAEASRLQLAFRFAMQLSIDRSAMHMFRDAERSIGGVRPALWEQRAALGPTSLALLATCELLEASSRHAGR